MLERQAPELADSAQELLSGPIDEDQVDGVVGVQSALYLVAKTNSKLLFLQVVGSICQRLMFRSIPSWVHLPGNDFCACSISCGMSKAYH